MKATRLDYLDGWRGVAITLLLLGHFFPLKGLALGTAGVDFFFALSGLLMGKLLFIQKTPIPVFYKRRISRIFPAHYFFISLIVIFYLTQNKQISWTETFFSSVFFYNYFPVLGDSVKMPFGHIWSLSVEEHSYVVLSIIAILTRTLSISPTKFIGLLVLVSAFLCILYPMLFSGLELKKMMLHTEVRSYSIFISVFFLLIFDKINMPILPPETYVSLTIFCLALYWWSIPNQLNLLLGSGLLALIVNLLHVAPPIIHKTLSIKPLRQLGIWSFSIYLWQQPFYLAYNEYFYWYIAVLCGVTLGVSSFYLIETPARQKLNSSWGKE